MLPGFSIFNCFRSKVRARKARVLVKPVASTNDIMQAPVTAAERMTIICAKKMKLDAEAQAMKELLEKQREMAQSKKMFRYLRGKKWPPGTVAPSNEACEEGQANFQGLCGLGSIEKFVGKEIPLALGLRVVLARNPAVKESIEEYFDRILSRGTIVWIDDDIEKGKCPEVCAVVWDASGARNVYRTGLSGKYDLVWSPDSEYHTAASVSAKDAGGRRRASTLPPLKPKPWRGFGMPVASNLADGDKSHNASDEVCCRPNVSVPCLHAIFVNRLKYNLVEADHRLAQWKH
jgi:hypothetical protein